MARLVLRRGAYPRDGDAETRPERGPFAFQIASPGTVRTRRVLLFALLGLVTYLLALFATAPARLIAGEGPGVQAVSGTVWAGEAALQGGHSASWTWSPLASLWKLGFAANVRVEGPDTGVTAEALIRPGSRALTEVRGAADGSLINALFPRFPVQCDFTMRIALDRLATGGQQPGAEGTVRTTGGTCAPPGAAPGFGRPLPPLVATSAINASGSTGWLAPQGERGRRLATWSATPTSALAVRLTPEGAALLPGGGAGLR